MLSGMWGQSTAYGRSEQDAAEIARHVANLVGESMWISAEIGDASIEVTPERKCKGKGINASE
jgi:hypothetical protein